MARTGLQEWQVCVCVCMCVFKLFFVVKKGSWSGKWNDRGTDRWLVESEIEGLSERERERERERARERNALTTWRFPMHWMPSPVKPLRQVQFLWPGAVITHLAWESQPPFFWQAWETGDRGKEKREGVTGGERECLIKKTVIQRHFIPPT